MEFDHVIRGVTDVMDCRHNSLFTFIIIDLTEFFCEVDPKAHINCVVRDRQR